VKLHAVHQQKGKVVLEISGMDLLDGTPVIDIKPYIPFSDAIPDALGGIAQQAPEQVNVSFSADADAQIASISARYPGLKQLIIAVLAQDPRPAYKKAKDDPKRYQVALYDLDIFWYATAAGIEVVALQPAPAKRQEQNCDATV
jgi:hypothetical protein